MNAVKLHIYADLTLAFRIAVLLFGIVMGVITLIACAKVADAATLKAASTITGGVLTAGDIFDGLDKDIASRVLGPAPMPGKDLTLNALTLMRVAAALDIAWQPDSPAEQITIRSASIVIDPKTINEALSAKLHEKGLNSRFAITFAGDPPQLVLPQNMPETVEVATIDYNAESDRFEATVVAPSVAHPTARATVVGHVDKLVSIPMLKKPMRAGDVITADAIEWTDMKTSDIQPDFIIDADQLIGATPRRMVMEEKPVRSGEVTAPLLVNRGQQVTITYAHGPITVTAKGKAMEDGAKGSLIHVVNLSSNKSLEATVDGQNTVSVTD